MATRNSHAFNETEFTVTLTPLSLASVMTYVIPGFVGSTVIMRVLPVERVTSKLVAFPDPSYVMFEIGPV